MPRRLASLAAVLAVITSLVTAACSSTPSVPTLTDPTEILSKGVANLATARSFHLKGGIDGSINLDMTGTGTATPLDLEGTTFEGDVDVAGKKAHLTFAAPALLGTTGEAILVDDTAYTKVSLFGPKFSKTEGAIGGTGISADPAKVISDVLTAIDELPTPPTKNADVKCGDTDCYSVTIDLPDQNLGTLSGGAVPLPSDTVGSGTIEFWVRRNDLRTTRIILTGDAGASGRLTVTLDITDYDASVTITAPPADQVAG